jgi:trk system potassium uptake protein
VSIFRLTTPVRPRVVAGHLGLLQLLLAGALVVPAVVAGLDGATGMAARLAVAVVTAAATGGLMVRHRQRSLDLREAFVVTVAAYLVWSLWSAAGYWPERGFVDAWFETLSGITTTGLSAIESPDLTYAERFLRAYLQWIGGAGIAVISLVVLTGPSGVALALYASERDPEGLLGSVRTTTRTVVAVYGVFSIALWIGFTLAGVGPADAVLAAMATIPTGGFSPWAGGMEAASGPVLAVAIAGMLAGGITLTLYVRPRLLVADRQVHALIGLTAGGALVAWGTAGFGIRPLFEAISSITTTGFNSIPMPDWSSPLEALSVLLMIVGGAAGSTAGGMKLFRLLAMVDLVRSAVARRLLPPEAVVDDRAGADGLRPGDLGGFLAAYAGLLLIGMLVLAFAGLDVGSSLFGSASALGTVGLWSGPPIGDLPVYARLALMVSMLAGRLEILAVIAALVPGTWRIRRRPSAS